MKLLMLAALLVLATVPMTAPAQAQEGDGAPFGQRTPGVTTAVPQASTRAAPRRAPVRRARPAPSPAR